MNRSKAAERTSRLAAARPLRRVCNGAPLRPVATSIGSRCDSRRARCRRTYSLASGAPKVVTLAKRPRIALAKTLGRSETCWSTRRDLNPRSSRWQSIQAPRGDASLRLLRRSGLHRAALDCTERGPTAPDGPSTDRCRAASLPERRDPPVPPHTARTGAGERARRMGESRDLLPCGENVVRRRWLRHLQGSSGFRTIGADTAPIGLRDFGASENKSV